MPDDHMTHELYDRLGRLEARQDATLKENERLRKIVEDSTSLSHKERQNIADRVHALEIVNAERRGTETARDGFARWTYRILKWMLPTIPYGAIAGFAVWLSHYWPWGQP